MALLNGILPIGFDDEGRTLPFAKLYTYAADSFTPKLTYQDKDLTIPNANPIIADGAGIFYNVYMSLDGYKLVVADQYDVVVNTQDNYYINVSQADVILTRQSITNDIASYSCTGPANAYVLTLLGGLVAPNSLLTGQKILFTPSASNTGSCNVTITLYDLSTVTVNIKMDNGSSNPVASFISSSYEYMFEYTGTVFKYLWHSGLVRTADINDSAVTTAKINDNAVTLAKIPSTTKNQIGNCRTATATSGDGLTYTLTSTSLTPLLDLAVNPCVMFNANMNSVGGSTFINLDGLGARPVITIANNGSPTYSVAKNDINTSTFQTAVYISSFGVWVLVDPVGKLSMAKNTDSISLNSAAATATITTTFPQWATRGRITIRNLSLDTNAENASIRLGYGVIPTYISAGYAGNMNKFLVASNTLVASDTDRAWVTTKVSADADDSWSGIIDLFKTESNIWIISSSMTQTLIATGSVIISTSCIVTVDVTDVLTSIQLIASGAAHLDGGTASIWWGP